MRKPPAWMGTSCPGWVRLPAIGGGDRVIPQGSRQPQYLTFVPRPLLRGRY
jgi:hypothetical protein